MPNSIARTRSRSRHRRLRLVAPLDLRPNRRRCAAVGALPSRPSCAPSPEKLRVAYPNPARTSHPWSLLARAVAPALFRHPRTPSAAPPRPNPAPPCLRRAAMGGGEGGSQGRKQGRRKERTDTRAPLASSSQRAVAPVPLAREREPGSRERGGKARGPLGHIQPNEPKRPRLALFHKPKPSRPASKEPELAHPPEPNRSRPASRRPSCPPV